MVFAGNAGEVDGPSTTTTLIDLAPAHCLAETLPMVVGNRNRNAHALLRRCMTIGGYTRLHHPVAPGHRMVSSERLCKFNWQWRGPSGASAGWDAPSFLEGPPVRWVHATGATASGKPY